MRKTHTLICRCISHLFSLKPSEQHKSNSWIQSLETLCCRASSSPVTFQHIIHLLLNVESLVFMIQFLLPWESSHRSTYVCVKLH